MIYTRKKLIRSDCSGYILLPVVIIISLLGIISFTTNRTNSANIKMLNNRMERVRATYVTRAGIAHAKWYLRNECQAISISDIPFQGHTYDINIQQSSGTLYRATVTSNLNNGVSNITETYVTCNNPYLYYTEDQTKKNWKWKIGSADNSFDINRNRGGYIPIIVDSFDDLVYWPEDNVIRKANLDGSEEADLFDCGVGCEPLDIALHLGGRLYWTNNNDGNIWWADVDGNGMEILVNTSGGKAYGIDLDLNEQKMYWVDQIRLEINKANLDGTDRSTIISFGLVEPSCIAVDSREKKIYWYDKIEETVKKIFRADFDGFNIETVVTFNGSDADIKGVLVDEANQKLYWTDNGNDIIGRSNLDGTSVETVMSIRNPWGIAIGAN